MVLASLAGLHLYAFRCVFQTGNFVEIVFTGEVGGTARVELSPGVGSAVRAAFSDGDHLQPLEARVPTKD